MTVHEATTDRLSFDATRRRYAEMYRALGIANLGATLSCGRDEALIEGFAPDKPASLEQHATGQRQRTGTRWYETAIAA